MRYSEFQILSEQAAGEVNLAQRLKKQLSGDARHAIDAWEMSNWVDGDLSTAYSKQNQIYQEIESAAEQLRSVIRSRKGDTVTLYRGIQQSGDDPSRHANRAIYSWTTRPKIAAVFAGLGRIDSEKKIKLNKDRATANQFILSLTDAQAKAIQDTVIKDGKAKWKNLYFVPSPYNNDYTDILKKRNGLPPGRIADIEHNNIARWLIRYRNDEKKFDQEVKSQDKDSGIVFKKEIPVDDIVWVLNAMGSMEYIVKGHSGINGERIEL